MTRIVSLETHDIRFPTSQALYGSDAMNRAPDYAAAYVVVRTGEDVSGHGFAFTIGRGNDVQLAAVRCLEPLVVGLDVEATLSDLGGFSRRLVWDSPLRWLGPEKGVIHMAIGAIVNAMWDLRAKLEGKPLWRLLAELSPEEIVPLVDFRYLRDALAPDEALELLQRRRTGSAERARDLEANGYAAYTTSAGWFGYDDGTVRALCEEAVKLNFPLVKMKVGGRPEDDLRRCRIAREAIGSERGLAVDANQVWEVDESIERIRPLEELGLSWVEEPTNPDDILGLARIRRKIASPVAAGEHVANRVVFKQLLQEEAIDIMQIDACRVAGVNENIANVLLAAKFGVPVFPHAGGVGLCEVVQHLAMFNHVALGAAPPARAHQLHEPMIEWIDHLHEHFVDPARVVQGRYIAPKEPGASTEMRPEALKAYRFPDGEVWANELARSSSPSGEGEGEAAPGERAR